MCVCVSVCVCVREKRRVFGAQSLMACSDVSIGYLCSCCNAGKGGSSAARPILLLVELWLFVVALSAALLSWRVVARHRWWRLVFVCVGFFLFPFSFLLYSSASVLPSASNILFASPTPAAAACWQRSCTRGLFVGAGRVRRRRRLVLFFSSSISKGEGKRKKYSYPL